MSGSTASCVEALPALVSRPDGIFIVFFLSLLMAVTAVAPGLLVAAIVDIMGVVGGLDGGDHGSDGYRNSVAGEGCSVGLSGAKQLV